MTDHADLGPPDSIPTEFVAESFETEVTDEAVEQAASIVEDAVRELRASVASDDRLQELLWSDPGDHVLTEADTAEQEDPEPLTQRAIIEPLFAGLGYPDLSVEVGDLSPERGRQADYSVSLREYDEIDSGRLLIEAEPLNKRLHQQRHGVGQVEDWLERDKFEATYGMATDGMRWVLIRRDRNTYRNDVLAEVDLQPAFLAAFEDLTGRQAGPDEWVDDGVRTVLAAFVRAFAYENFLSIAGEAREVIKETKRAITDEFYQDYVRLVFGVVEEGVERTDRSLIGEGVVAPAGATGDDVRLFAVELMNRLVFIKFLEDKGLVEETLLRDLRSAHEAGRHPGSFYKTFLEPIFSRILDERPDERTERIRELYEDVPYLDGGLFRPEIDGDAFDERDFDVRDSVLTSIVDLLERYRFSADGGPTDLDPSVLGNVFEKTINYITTDSGDQQKELGAYYTPDEITSFCAEETVRPALHERFAERMVEQWGWTDEMVDHEDVYGLIDALPETNVDVVEDLLGVVDRFRALDPACGSGHFLTSVQSEIVAVRKALYEKHHEVPSDWELRKETVVRNVYGVDLVEPAVEIAKLRLWLSIIAEVDPDEVNEYDDDELALPNVVFNVRQGNSLIGFTELMETTGDGDQTQLDSWGPDSVRAKYGEIIELVEKHKGTTETEEANKYLKEAEELLEGFRGDLDEKILSDFREAGVDNISPDQIQEFKPFHWVLEFSSVYADGGFDVIVGNPPWDVLTISRDDFFSRHDMKFRTRTPNEKDRMIQSLFNEKDDLEGKWERYQRNMNIRAEYFTNGSTYRLQTPTVAGQTNTNENDLSALFLERVFQLAGDDGHVAQILPGNIFNGSATKDLRTKLLDETTVSTLVEFENHGIFDKIDNRYRFGVLVFKNSGQTKGLHGIFQQRDLDILDKMGENGVDIPRNVLDRYSPEARIFPAITNQREVNILEKILSNPSLASTKNDTWTAKAHRELILAYDDDRLIESNGPTGDYPVVGGANFYQFMYNNEILTDLESPKFWSVEEEADPRLSAKKRIREKEFNKGNLKKEVYEEFEGTETSKSQMRFVDDLLKETRDEPLGENDIRLDCTEYRIVFRDVSNATNERTMIASVLPKGWVCLDSVRTVRPFKIDVDEDDLEKYPLHGAYQRIFTDEELFLLLGFLNSVPFDFLIRTKVSSHIPKYKFEESQVPRLTEGDDWFEYIWTRAARLNCYGEAFAEMRERLGGIEPAIEMDERARLQAEIDAAAFHAYGLDREETAFVLDDFHRVKNPRLMTDEYFESVLSIYDDLAERGP